MEVWFFFGFKPFRIDYHHKIDLVGRLVEIKIHLGKNISDPWEYYLQNFYLEPITKSFW